MGSAWNSLEIVKLAVAALTPILVVVAGFWLNRRLKSVEQAQWSQQKIIERRIRAYDEIAPPMNDLFCFYCYVGGWKELTPPGVVHLKRDLDRVAHISAPLFDTQFLPRYNRLMDLFFSTFGNWGEDAKLKTLPDRRKQALPNQWDLAWDQCFADRSLATEPDAIKPEYGSFMAYLAGAIGAVGVDEHLLASTQTPGNFDTRAAGIVSVSAKPAD